MQRHEWIPGFGGAMAHCDGCGRIRRWGTWRNATEECPGRQPKSEKRFNVIVTDKDGNELARYTPGLVKDVKRTDDGYEFTLTAAEPGAYRPAPFTFDWFDESLRVRCPDAPHRGPQGPNEDIGQCNICGMPSYWMRPEGETFGNHLPDCSLPVDHESFCVGGGSGHPPSKVVRG